MHKIRDKLGHGFGFGRSSVIGSSVLLAVEVLQLI
jgi:hypothetical protein